MKEKEQNQQSRTISLHSALHQERPDTDSFQVQLKYSRREENSCMKHTIFTPSTVNFKASIHACSWGDKSPARSHERALKP